MFNGKLIKKRILPAIAMIVSGAVIYIGCTFYNPVKPEAVVAETAAEPPQNEKTIPAETLGAKKVIYKEEEGWKPSPDELNLAHIFPEGADTGEISESYGGLAFNNLVRRESSWWSTVYSSASLTPAQLAVQLGRDVSSVYSSAGEVISFKSIHMNVANGDGTPVNLKSNIIQIMSMANVYFYYHDVDDYDGFLRYCQDLFDRSHSYSVSMSGVYYCDGSCQNSSVDSEEFDEDFFTYDTNFNMAEEGGEPVSYLYEPIYETEDETGDSSDVIISGEARQSYEESLERSLIGPASGNGSSVDEVYEEEITAIEEEMPEMPDETLTEETQRETRSGVWKAEEETETAVYEDAEALAQAEAESRAAAEAEAAAQAEAEAQARAAAESQAAAEAEAAAAAQAAAEAEAAAAAQAAAEEEAAAATQAAAEEEAAAAAQVAAETVYETESQVFVIRAGESSTTEASHEDYESDAFEEDVWEPAEEYDSEIVEEYDTASSSDADDTETSSSSNKKSTARCPGHVDLTINIRIYDLDGVNNLYTIDVIGSKADEVIEDEESVDLEETEESEEEPGEKEESDNASDLSDGIKKPVWPGWEEEQRLYVDILSNRDWYEEYGLSLSTFSFGNPLTPSEINRYMSMLPENLSDTRRKVIQFALQSVGRVPYYWGGKASYAGYEGNNFGMLVDPDHSGRVLKGLDCSGWIGWVYWSVMGTPSPAESTSTLCDMGQAVSLSQMQPGDIAVRTGSSAHVIMFLGWAEDGNILCIHESSAGVNNVTIAERAPSWPYYRSIFD